jgi:hypothetical protein
MQNPTGYAQVVYESFSGNPSLTRENAHSYAYGLERIAYDFENHLVQVPKFTVLITKRLRIVNDSRPEFFANN